MLLFVIPSCENCIEFLKRVSRSSLRRVLDASAHLDGPNLRN